MKILNQIDLMVLSTSTNFYPIIVHLCINKDALEVIVDSYERTLGLNSSYQNFLTDSFIFNRMILSGEIKEDNMIAFDCMDEYKSWIKSVTDFINDPMCTYVTITS